jgi:hypothetical protein
MAKQKKAQPRRVSRAASPRMYGDGKSSEAKDSAQAASQPTTSASQGARSGGATPRATTGAGGSYARVSASATTDYSYVKHDLRRLGIVAAAILGALVVLGIILP